jgi:hypothetical protein
LLAGRIDLKEAAARFQEITAADLNDILPLLRLLHPGRTDAEIYYLHVIMYLQGRAIAEPEIRERIEHWKKEIEDLKAAGTFDDPSR